MREALAGWDGVVEIFVDDAGRAYPPHHCFRVAATHPFADVEAARRHNRERNAWLKARRQAAADELNREFAKVAEEPDRTAELLARYNRLRDAFLIACRRDGIDPTGPFSETSESIRAFMDFMVLDCIGVPDGLDAASALVIQRAFAASSPAVQTEG